MRAHVDDYFDGFNFELRLRKKIATGTAGAVAAAAEDGEKGELSSETVRMIANEMVGSKLLIYGDGSETLPRDSYDSDGDDDDIEKSGIVCVISVKSEGDDDDDEADTLKSKSEMAKDRNKYLYCLSEIEKDMIGKEQKISAEKMKTRVCSEKYFGAKWRYLDRMDEYEAYEALSKLTPCRSNAQPSYYGASASFSFPFISE